MRILLLNPPHTAIGSRIPREHLPPLGLLSVGGPLLDAGFDVELLDAEFGPMAVGAIIDEIARRAPDLLLVGHSGSTSAHPTIALIAARIKAPAFTRLRRASRLGFHQAGSQGQNWGTTWLITGRRSGSRIWQKASSA